MGQRGGTAGRRSGRSSGPQIDDVMSRGEGDLERGPAGPVWRNGRIEEVLLDLRLLARVRRSRECRRNARRLHRDDGPRARGARLNGMRSLAKDTALRPAPRAVLDAMRAPRARREDAPFALIYMGRGERRSRRLSVGGPPRREAGRRRRGRPRRSCPPLVDQTLVLEHELPGVSFQEARGRAVDRGLRRSARRRRTWTAERFLVFGLSPRLVRRGLSGAPPAVRRARRPGARAYRDLPGTRDRRARSEPTSSRAREPRTAPRTSFSRCSATSYATRSRRS